MPDTPLAWGPLITDIACTTDELDHMFPEPRTVPSVSDKTLAFMVVSDSRASLVRCHLEAQHTAKPRVRVVPLVLRSDNSIRHVGVGTSGRRAVWMEQNLDTTRSRLMRLEVLHDEPDDFEVMYQVLLPPDPPLPFSTDTCQAIAFDEASCRLCFGLWDGDLYLVDFL